MPTSTSPTLSDALSSLANQLRGGLTRPGDPDYDDVRAMYNGMVDKRPTVIVRCQDVADVIASVHFARDSGLPLAIRGGGHNGPGLGSVDDGLVIDLSAMRDVRVDPAAGTVRVAAGCTSGDVDHATHPFGLAVPFGIVSTTGVAGLTLGGGTGYLTRKYGLTIDNLLKADVVLANGEFVTASETRHADLFWALCGGGGNFGVVTSFLFRAHPVAQVFAGPVFWDIEHARRVMQVYREFLPEAPEELGIFIGLKTVPSLDPFPEEHRGKRACAVIACYNGATAPGAAAMSALMDACPAPLFDWRQEMPFPAIQSMFDPFFPKGLQWYWKGDYVAELTDEAIDAHIAQMRNAPSELSLMHLYAIDGAVQRRAGDATAFAARDATWSMVIAAVDDDPLSVSRLKDWGRDYWGAVHRFNRAGGYVNFLMDDENDDRIQASYGKNYARLVAIKTRYDPHNLFRINQNIPPA